MQLTLPQLTEERLRLAAAIRAPATLLGYSIDWKQFSAWCEAHQRSPLPASTDTVGLYLTDRLNRGGKVVTASRHMTSIRHAHLAAGFESPGNRKIVDLLAGAQRIRRERPAQKTPLSVEQLRQICPRIPGTDARAARDRAVLLFGFATALRRSNLVALDLADLAFVEKGVLVRVQREKQDRAGVGREIGVPFGQHDTCPVRALQTWLEKRGSAPGPVFTRILNGRAGGRLHPDFVNRLVKRSVKLIGLDPAAFGAHSTRSGFVTEAINSGVSEFLVAQHTGHRKLETLRRYFRPRDPFQANACASLGL